VDAGQPPRLRFPANCRAAPSGQTRPNPKVRIERVLKRDVPVLINAESGETIKQREI
jgi:hypothetical protein